MSEPGLPCIHGLAFLSRKKPCWFLSLPAPGSALQQGSEGGASKRMGSALLRQNEKSPSLLYSQAGGVGDPRKPWPLLLAGGNAINRLHIPLGLPQRLN